MVPYHPTCRANQGAQARRAGRGCDDAEDAHVEEGERYQRHPPGHHAEPEVPPQVSFPTHTPI